MEEINSLPMEEAATVWEGKGRAHSFLKKVLAVLTTGQLHQERLCSTLTAMRGFRMLGHATHQPVRRVMEPPGRGETLHASEPRRRGCGTGAGEPWACLRARGTGGMCDEG